MPVQEQALKAIESLNGLELQHRSLKVTEADPTADIPTGDEYQRPKRQRIGVVKAASSAMHNRNENPQDNIPQP